MRTSNSIQVTEEGFLNDVEAAIVKLCNDFFQDDQNLMGHAPRNITALNPNEVALPDGLPAVYTWVSGFAADTNQMGGLGGQRVSRKFDIYCNIQYILTEVEDETSSKEVRKVAWWLFDLLNKNLDLGGLVLGSPRIEEVEMMPRWRLIGGEIRSCSTVNIRFVYTSVDMTTISQRR